MQARLIEAVELAPDLRRLVFQAEGVERLDFVPGQWVSLSAPVSGKTVTRAYSLASVPGAGNRFELCLNLVPEGVFSGPLFAMKPGETVEMQPPLGTFVLRQPPRDSVFIATGTGIAPFRSIIASHLNESSPAFTLLFGARFASHLTYAGEFEELARRFPQFRFWPTLTRPEQGWSGRTGRVQAHLEEALGGRRDIDVYLCGLKAMVDDVRAILKGRGFDRKQIFYEKYD